ncbi:D-alanyl-D-alanine carboxypeptidase [Clostridium fermenticellae]|uniref:serine-type D-Ala-D-Ala carboxypeptidase n=1 Tax=Clostridium fermenticellae TaxID=2068654 RepID=A0A386H658_9CLOT|nr:D-alanyl-D-alanine carboxypeptidase family protein [Clostridium fermenticellae]AYD41005.1 D-alanyl-D-alanine carboxypeptidase [Clostridium fermenticellae]
MKKFLTFLTCFFIVLTLFPLTVQASNDPPSVSADSCVVMDATTGTLLYGKNENAAYPPASTTKLMTALLTLESCNLDDIVTIGKNPPNADGSKIYLYEGEEIKVRDLLYGLILVSGNDCAQALAEYISGSCNKFAQAMNKRALELGCKNTNFVNPSGLYNINHKTSAKDLSLIMRALSKNPEYIKIATTSFYSIPSTNKSTHARPLWNENKLIQKSSSFYYPGCIGGKTGYTIQSFHSYVACATQNGRTLIVALLHDKKKTFFPDSIALFNYAFNNFDWTKIYSKGDLVTTYNKNGLKIPLLASSDFYYIRPKTDIRKPTFRLENKNLNLKLFKKGDTIATADIFVNNKMIGKLELKSGTDHKFEQAFKLTFNSRLTPYIIFPAVLVILGSSIFIFKKLKPAQK